MLCTGFATARLDSSSVRVKVQNTGLISGACRQEVDMEVGSGRSQRPATYRREKEENILLRLNAVAQLSTPPPAAYKLGSSPNTCILILYIAKEMQCYCDHTAPTLVLYGSIPCVKHCTHKNFNMTTYTIQCFINVYM